MLVAGCEGRKWGGAGCAALQVTMLSFEESQSNRDSEFLSFMYSLSPNQLYIDYRFLSEKRTYSKKKKKNK